MNALRHLKSGIVGHFATNAYRGNWLDHTILAGLWLRLILFIVLSPYNCDSLGHLEHILYIKECRWLPSSGLGHETWQPPLYYIISAFLALISQAPKFLQTFPLVTSIATLYVARELIGCNTFFTTKEGKALAALIICFLPQLVMYSLQLSNDSLTIFLGFLAFHQGAKLAAGATTVRFLAFSVLLSLGLLTKGHFLIISALLFPVACLCFWRQRPKHLSKTVVSYATAFAIMLLGCGKYFQNVMEYGRPFISNNDFSPTWLEQNQGSYKGWISIVDVNVWKLVRRPVKDVSTQHSIPLLLYGSFWYHYFNDSNFRGNLSEGPKWIGRYLHIIGIVPATLLVCGGFFSLRCFERVARSGGFASSDDATIKFSAISAFVASVALMIYLFLKYDTWIMVVGRYLFPTLIGGCVLCDMALQWLKGRCIVTTIFSIWKTAFVAGITTYFAAEIALQFRE